MSFFLASLGLRGSAAVGTARQSSGLGGPSTTTAAADSIDCQRPSDAVFSANQPVLPAEFRKSGELVGVTRSKNILIKFRYF